MHMALCSIRAATQPGQHKCPHYLQAVVQEAFRELIPCGGICSDHKKSWHRHSSTAFGFPQALAREVAYELIPFSQRRRLHAALAEAQEAALKRDPCGAHVPTAANIAYNYSCACATVEVTEWRYALLVSLSSNTPGSHACHRMVCCLIHP